MKTYKLDKINNTNPIKTGDDISCSGSVNSSCFINDTHHVPHVTNPVINEKTGIDYDKWNISEVIFDTDIPLRLTKS